MNAGAPVAPRARLCLGVTGHREDNAAFTANAARIDAVLERLLDRIASAVDEQASSLPTGVATTRLHCLLADGADHMAAQSALRRGWELIAPLPFGLTLNVAINSHPVTAQDVRALLGGEEGTIVCAPEVRERAMRIYALAGQAHVFALADRDEAITRALLDKLAFPDDARKASNFNAESSLRAALAGRVMIEQSDLLIAVWDGGTRALVGGTGHTIQVALETGAPVLWIDANRPEHWRILSGPESLACLQGESAEEGVQQAELLHIIRRALRPAASLDHDEPHSRRASAGPETLARERLPARSNPVFHFYRRIEALFGADTVRGRFRSLRQRYETPDEVASGSAAPLLAHAGALPGHDVAQVGRIKASILRRFAWADGVSARLSDTYRGSMTSNFLLATLAIVGGIAYLPLASSDSKWIYATFELLLLLGILAITIVGQRRRWHGRWFETRRVAEYFRHAPILLLLGVMRAPGRWPLGTDTSWPEWYARHGLREVGLPRLTLTQQYLREAVGGLLKAHVVSQRDYHVVKARRLSAVHHNLDAFSEVLFKLAVVSVATYLVLKAGGELHWWSRDISHDLSYYFTFLGVLLPTLGGAIAGIRYFGDFERFAAISRVTSEKLTAIESRIEQLLAAPAGAIDYGRAADLAHAADDVVVAEIESWQAVFGGKHVTVPV